MDDATFDFVLSDLVRALGLHQPDRTPCGQPFSPSEALTLLHLHDSDEPVLQKQLAAALGLQKSTVSRLLDGLARRGLVDRLPHPDGGRVLRVALTDDGRRQVAQLRAARRDRLERLMAAIPAEDRPAVVKAVRLLIEAGNASR